MAKKKQAQVSAGFAIDKKSLGQIAEAGAAALVDGGKIVVKSGGRSLAAPGGGGYETRLWEKVTCDFLGGLQPGDDVVIRPDMLGITVTPAAALKRTKRKTSRKSK